MYTISINYLKEINIVQIANYSSIVGVYYRGINLGNFFQLLANCQKSKSNKDDTEALPSMPVQKGRAFVLCENGTGFLFTESKY